MQYLEYGTIEKLKIDVVKSKASIKNVYTTAVRIKN